jgi:hypothetical protein
MHAAALNLTTKVTVSQRFLVVGLPQRGAEAALATALDRPEEGIENVHEVAGHRLAEAGLLSTSAGGDRVAAVALTSGRVNW